MTWQCRMSDEVHVYRNIIEDLSATASKSSSTMVRMWSILHDLAKQGQSDDITDERLVSNGINIQFYQGKVKKI